MFFIINNKKGEYGLDLKLNLLFIDIIFRKCIDIVSCI